MRQRRRVAPRLLRFGRRIQGWIFRPTAHEEVEDEMDFHVSMRAREYEGMGMAADEARRLAEARLGDRGSLGAELEGIARRRNRRRDMKLVVEEAVQDVRYALRQLRRNPAFAAAAIFTLAIGIGANSAVFSVVNGVLLEPLPYEAPDELVTVHTAFPTQGFDEFWMSPPEFYELRETNTVFDDMGAWRVGASTIETLDRPVRVPSAVATWSFFTALGVEAAYGRTFLEEEDRIGAQPVVLLSHGLWERGFAADPAVVGATVRVSGQTATIVGVLPEGFDIEGARVDVWSPLNAVTGVDPNDRTTSWGNHYMNVVARVADGVGPERVAEELARVGQRASEMYSANVHDLGGDTHPLHTTDLRTELLGDVRPALLLLTGAVAFVLLIACANVANLLLARAQRRTGEVAVRVAMGAGRARLVRQLLTEGLALAVAGAALGLVLADAGTRLLLGVNPDAVPRVAGIGLDGRVIAFTAIVAVATGLLFGLAPLLGTGSARVGTTLKEGGTRTTRGSAGALARRALVTAEVALAVVLLVGAGLMLRSVAALRSVDLGFDAENVLSFRLSLPPADYPDPASVGGFHARLLERVGAQPGVVAASATSNLPPFHVLVANDTEFEGVPQTPDGPPHNVDYYTVIEDGYLDVMGIGLVEGRGFEPADALSETPVMLVSERLARTFYPDQSPLGRRIDPGGAGNALFTVVGVVEDVTQPGIGAPAGTELYFYGPQLAQAGAEGGREMSVVIRTERDPLALAAGVERLLGELDPSLAVAELETLEQRVDRALAQPRFLTLLLGVFAAVALLLAAVGTYGVMANSVAERSREIGIRMAMGAQPASVRGLVLGEGALLAATGLGLGLIGAFALSRFLAAQLFEVGATDPATFAAVPLFLAGVALLATWIPARRATHVDPVEALREA